MHHNLRETAKVLVGLFVADLASVLWLGGTGFFPLTILGITWTSAAILPITVFDSAAILLLANYGWRMELPIRSLSERKLLMFVGLVFLVVALLHLLRIAFNWNLVLGGAVVPAWLSWVGVIIPGYLSYSSFHFALHDGR